MHEKTRLLSVILKALLCVVLLSVATYAWVSQNRETGSGSISVNIDAKGETITKYHVYSYNQEKRSGEDITQTAYRLNSYDSIFLENNDKMAMFFVLHLDEIKSPYFEIVVSCSNPVWVGDPDTAHSSDILKVACATGDDVGASYYSTTGDNLIFNMLLSYFNGSGSTGYRTFVDKSTRTTDGGHIVYTDKSASLIFPVDLGELPEDKSADVVLSFDYDEELIGAQRILNFGESAIISLGEAIAFDSDINTIEFVFETTDTP